MMKHEVYFSNIENVGNLYLDYIFFEFENEPLLFTCVDDNGRIYFCHCYKMIYEQKWFVLPVSVDVLKDLVSGIRDIRSTILSSISILDITRLLDGQELNSWMRATDVFSEDLPSSGTFLECDRDDAKLYIARKEVVEFSDGGKIRGTITGDVSSVCITSYGVKKKKIAVSSNTTLNRSSMLTVSVDSICKNIHKAEWLTYDLHAGKHPMLYEDDKIKSHNYSEIDINYTYAS